MGFFDELLDEKQEQRRVVREQIAELRAVHKSKLDELQAQDAELTADIADVQAYLVYKTAN